MENAGKTVSTYANVSLAQPYAIANYLAASLVAFPLLAYGVWSGAWPPGWLLSSPSPLFKMLAYTFSFGGLGATCYSSYGLYKHVAAGDYNPDYMYCDVPPENWAI